MVCAMRTLQELGFLGCGHMGQALLAGWLKAGRVRADQVTIADKYPAEETAQRFGVRASDNQSMVDRCDVVLLAVKPQHVAGVLGPLRFRSDQLIVSIAAGVSRARIVEAASPATVVRTMPNITARVGAGVSLVSAGPDSDFVHALFGGVGHAEVLADEDWFHAATALVGSGPAYLFVAIEALADGAVAAGLPRALALRLAAHTVRGSGALAAEGEHPAVLKDQVASPGGTTIAALGVLESRGYRSALMDAVIAATKRSRELESS